MAFELYSEVILTRDVPEEGLRAGDVGTIVERHVAPGAGGEGYSIEFFDMTGNSVAVATLPAGALRPTRLIAQRSPHVSLRSKRAYLERATSSRAQCSRGQVHDSRSLFAASVDRNRGLTSPHQRVRRPQFKARINVLTTDGKPLHVDLPLPELPVGNDEEAWYLVHYGPKGREGAHETVTPTIPAIYIGA